MRDLIRVKRDICFQGWQQRHCSGLLSGPQWQWVNRGAAAGGSAGGARGPPEVDCHPCQGPSTSVEQTTAPCPLCGEPLLPRVTGKSELRSCFWAGAPEERFLKEVGSRAERKQKDSRTLPQREWGVDSCPRGTWQSSPRCLQGRRRSLRKGSGGGEIWRGEGRHRGGCSLPWKWMGWFCVNRPGKSQ